MDRIDELEVEIAKSGYDEWSKMHLPALNERLPRESMEIAAELPDTTEQAMALRWVLRGKSVEWAIAKVKYDSAKKDQFRQKGHDAKELREIIGF